MKIPAYLVEYSDDLIDWRLNSLYLDLIAAVEAGDKLSYKYRVRKIFVESGEIVSDDEIVAVKKAAKILTQLFQ
jgi:hypothetical protein